MVSLSSHGHEETPESLKISLKSSNIITRFISGHPRPPRTSHSPGRWVVVPARPQRVARRLNSCCIFHLPSNHNPPADSWYHRLGPSTLHHLNKPQHHNHASPLPHDAGPLPLPPSSRPSSAIPIISINHSSNTWAQQCGNARCLHSGEAQHRRPYDTVSSTHKAYLARTFTSPTC